MSLNSFKNQISNIKSYISVRAYRWSDCSTGSNITRVSNYFTVLFSNRAKGSQTSTSWMELSALNYFWAYIVCKNRNVQQGNYDSAVFYTKSLNHGNKFLTLGQTQVGNPLKELQLSPWPILLSIFLLNGALIIIGLFNGIIYKDTYLFFSFFLFIFSIISWLLDLSREGSFLGNHISVIKTSLYYGLGLFIVSEIMFFFSLFWTFFNSILSGSIWVGCSWPPLGLNTYLQSVGLELAIVNTCILLFSGYTLTLAHEFYIFKNKFLSIYFLFFTILLGIFFMFVQVFEFKNSLYCFNDSVYSSVFFFLTGFHGLHVVLGIKGLLFSLYRSILDYTRADQHLGFEAAIWYWHFVDVVWLLVFCLIYIWGNASTSASVEKLELVYYSVGNRLIPILLVYAALLFLILYPNNYTKMFISFSKFRDFGARAPIFFFFKTATTFFKRFSRQQGNTSSNLRENSLTFVLLGMFFSLFITGDMPVFDPISQFKLQDGASLVSFASKHFFLSMYILTVFVVFFVLFITLLFVYSHEDQVNNKKFVEAPQKTHNTFLEAIWTTLPSGTISTLAASSFILLFISDVGNSFRFYGDLISNKFPSALRTRVTGSQWFWTYNYDLPKFTELADATSKVSRALEQVMRQISSVLPGEHRLLSTGDNLVLPTFTLLRFYITSTDVIHSFALPSMYIKLDACPGRLNLLSTVVTRIGAFYGQCSEICGINHSFMPISTEIVDSKNFWSGVTNFIAAQYNEFVSKTVGFSEQQLIAPYVEAVEDQLNAAGVTVKMFADYLQVFNKEFAIRRSRKFLSEIIFSAPSSSSTSSTGTNKTDLQASTPLYVRRSEIQNIKVGNNDLGCDVFVSSRRPAVWGKFVWLEQPDRGRYPRKYAVTPAVVLEATLGEFYDTCGVSEYSDDKMLRGSKAYALRYETSTHDWEQALKYEAWITDNIHKLVSPYTLGKLFGFYEKDWYPTYDYTKYFAKDYRNLNNPYIKDEKNALLTLLPTSDSRTLVFNFARKRRQAIIELNIHTNKLYFSNIGLSTNLWMYSGEQEKFSTSHSTIYEWLFGIYRIRGVEITSWRDVLFGGVFIKNYWTDVSSYFKLKQFDIDILAEEYNRVAEYFDARRYYNYTRGLCLGPEQNPLKIEPKLIDFMGKRSFYDPFLFYMPTTEDFTGNLATWILPRSSFEMAYKLFIEHEPDYTRSVLFARKILTQFLVEFAKYTEDSTSFPQVPKYELIPNTKKEEFINFFLIFVSLELQPLYKEVLLEPLDAWFEYYCYRPCLDFNFDITAASPKLYSSFFTSKHSNCDLVATPLVFFELDSSGLPRSWSWNVSFTNDLITCASHVFCFFSELFFSVLQRVASYEVESSIYALEAKLATSFIFEVGNDCFIVLNPDETPSAPYMYWRSGAYWPHQLFAFFSARDLCLDFIKTCQFICNKSTSPFVLFYNDRISWVFERQTSLAAADELKLKAPVSKWVVSRRISDFLNYCKDYRDTYLYVTYLPASYDEHYYWRAVPRDLYNLGGGHAEPFEIFMNSEKLLAIQPPSFIIISRTARSELCVLFDTYKNNNSTLSFTQRLIEYYYGNCFPAHLLYKTRAGVHKIFLLDMFKTDLEVRNELMGIKRTSTFDEPIEEYLGFPRDQYLYRKALLSSRASRANASVDIGAASRSFEMWYFKRVRQLKSALHKLIFKRLFSGWVYSHLIDQAATFAWDHCGFGYFYKFINKFRHLRGELCWLVYTNFFPDYIQKAYLNKFLNARTTSYKNAYPALSTRLRALHKQANKGNKGSWNFGNSKLWYSKKYDKTYYYVDLFNYKNYKQAFGVNISKKLPSKIINYRTVRWLKDDKKHALLRLLSLGTDRGVARKYREPQLALISVECSGCKKSNRIFTVEEAPPHYKKSLQTYKNYTVGKRPWNEQFKPAPNALYKITHITDLDGFIIDRVFWFECGAKKCFSVTKVNASEITSIIQHANINRSATWTWVASCLGHSIYEPIIRMDGSRFYFEHGLTEVAKKTQGRFGLSASGKLAKKKRRSWDDGELGPIRRTVKRKIGHSVKTHIELALVKDDSTIKRAYMRKAVQYCFPTSKAKDLCFWNWPSFIAYFPPIEKYLDLGYTYNRGLPIYASRTVDEYLHNDETGTNLRKYGAGLHTIAGSFAQAEVEVAAGGYDLAPKPEEIVVLGKPVEETGVAYDLIAADALRVASAAQNTSKVVVKLDKSKLTVEKIRRFCAPEYFTELARAGSLEIPAVERTEKSLGATVGGLHATLLTVYPQNTNHLAVATVEKESRYVAANVPVLDRLGITKFNIELSAGCLDSVLNSENYKDIVYNSLQYNKYFNNNVWLYLFSKNALNDKESSYLLNGAVDDAILGLRALPINTKSLGDGYVALSVGLREQAREYQDINTLLDKDEQQQCNRNVKGFYVLRLHPFYREQRAGYVEHLISQKKKPQTLLRPLADNLYPFFSNFRFNTAAYVKQPLDAEFLAPNIVRYHSTLDWRAASSLSFSKYTEDGGYKLKASEATTQPGNLVSMVGFFTYYSRHIQSNPSATFDSIFELDDFASKCPVRSGSAEIAGWPTRIALDYSFMRSELDLIVFAQRKHFTSTSEESAAAVSSYYADLNKKFLNQTTLSSYRDLYLAKKKDNSTSFKKLNNIYPTQLPSALMDGRGYTFTEDTAFTDIYRTSSGGNVELNAALKSLFEAINIDPDLLTSGPGAGSYKLSEIAKVPGTAASLGLTPYSIVRYGFNAQLFTTLDMIKHESNSNKRGAEDSRLTLFKTAENTLVAEPDSSDVGRALLVSGRGFTKKSGERVNSAKCIRGDDWGSLVKYSTYNTPTGVKLSTLVGKQFLNSLKAEFPALQTRHGSRALEDILGSEKSVFNLTALATLFSADKFTVNMDRFPHGYNVRKAGPIGRLKEDTMRFAYDRPDSVLPTAGRDDYDNILYPHTNKIPQYSVDNPTAGDFINTEEFRSFYNSKLLLTDSTDFILNPIFSGQTRSSLHTQLDLLRTSVPFNYYENTPPGYPARNARWLGFRENVLDPMLDAYVTTLLQKRLDSSESTDLVVWKDKYVELSKILGNDPKKKKEYSLLFDNSLSTAYDYVNIVINPRKPEIFDRRFESITRVLTKSGGVLRNNDAVLFSVPATFEKLSSTSISNIVNNKVFFEGPYTSSIIFNSIAGAHTPHVQLPFPLLRNFSSLNNFKNTYGNKGVLDSSENFDLTRLASDWGILDTRFLSGNYHNHAFDPRQYSVNSQLTDFNSTGDALATRALLRASYDATKYRTPFYQIPVRNRNVQKRYVDQTFSRGKYVKYKPGLIKKLNTVNLLETEIFSARERSLYFGDNVLYDSTGDQGKEASIMQLQSGFDTKGLTDLEYLTPGKITREGRDVFSFFGENAAILSPFVIKNYKLYGLGLDSMAPFDVMSRLYSFSDLCVDERRNTTPVTLTPKQFEKLKTIIWTSPVSLALPDIYPNDSWDILENLTTLRGHNPARDSFDRVDAVRRSERRNAILNISENYNLLSSGFAEANIVWGGPGRSAMAEFHDEVVVKPLLETTLFDPKKAVAPFAPVFNKSLYRNCAPYLWYDYNKMVSSYTGNRNRIALDILEKNSLLLRVSTNRDSNFSSVALKNSFAFIKQVDLSAIEPDSARAVNRAVPWVNALSILDNLHEKFEVAYLREQGLRGPRDSRRVPQCTDSAFVTSIENSSGDYQRSCENSSRLVVQSFLATLVFGDADKDSGLFIKNNMNSWFSRSDATLDSHLANIAIALNLKQVLSPESITYQDKETRDMLAPAFMEGDDSGKEYFVLIDWYLKTVNKEKNTIFFDSTDGELDEHALVNLPAPNTMKNVHLSAKGVTNYLIETMALPEKVLIKNCLKAVANLAAYEHMLLTKDFVCILSLLKEIMHLDSVELCQYIYKNSLAGSTCKLAVDPYPANLGGLVLTDNKSLLLLNVDLRGVSAVNTSVAGKPVVNLVGGRTNLQLCDKYINTWFSSKIEISMKPDDARNFINYARHSDTLLSSPSRLVSSLTRRFSKPEDSVQLVTRLKSTILSTGLCEATKASDSAVNRKGIYENFFSTENLHVLDRIDPILDPSSFVDALLLTLYLNKHKTSFVESHSNTHNQLIANNLVFSKEAYLTESADQFVNSYSIAQFIDFAGLLSFGADWFTMSKLNSDAFKKLFTAEPAEGLIGIECLEEEEDAGLLDGEDAIEKYLSEDFTPDHDQKVEIFSDSEHDDDTDEDVDAALLQLQTDFYNDEEGEENVLADSFDEESYIAASNYALYGYESDDYYRYSGSVGTRRQSVLGQSDSQAQVIEIEDVVPNNPIAALNSWLGVEPAAAMSAAPSDPHLALNNWLGIQQVAPQATAMTLEAELESIGSAARATQDDGEEDMVFMIRRLVEEEIIAKKIRETKAKIEMRDAAIHAEDALKSASLDEPLRSDFYEVAGEFEDLTAVFNPGDEYYEEISSFASKSSELVREETVEVDTLLLETQASIEEVPAEKFEMFRQLLRVYGIQHHRAQSSNTGRPAHLKPVEFTTFSDFSRFIKEDSVSQKIYSRVPRGSVSPAFVNELINEHLDFFGKGGDDASLKKNLVLALSSIFNSNSGLGKFEPFMGAWNYMFIASLVEKYHVDTLDYFPSAVNSRYMRSIVNCDFVKTRMEYNGATLFPFSDSATPFPSTKKNSPAVNMFISAFDGDMFCGGNRGLADDIVFKNSGRSWISKYRLPLVISEARVANRIFGVKRVVSRLVGSNALSKKSYLRERSYPRSIQAGINYAVSEAVFDPSFPGITARVWGVTGVNAYTTSLLGRYNYSSFRSRETQLVQPIFYSGMSTDVNSSEFKNRMSSISKYYFKTFVSKSKKQGYHSYKGKSELLFLDGMHDLLQQKIRVAGLDSALREGQSTRLVVGDKRAAPVARKLAGGHDNAINGSKKYILDKRRLYRNSHSLVFGGNKTVTYINKVRKHLARYKKENLPVYDTWMEAYIGKMYENNTRDIQRKGYAYNYGGPEGVEAQVLNEQAPVWLTDYLKIEAVKSSPEAIKAEVDFVFYNNTVSEYNLVERIASSAQSYQALYTPGAANDTIKFAASLDNLHLVKKWSVYQMMTSNVNKILNIAPKKGKQIVFKLSDDLYVVPKVDYVTNLQGQVNITARSIKSEATSGLAPFLVGEVTKETVSLVEFIKCLEPGFNDAFDPEFVPNVIQFDDYYQRTIVPSKLPAGSVEKIAAMSGGYTSTRSMRAGEVVNRSSGMPLSDTIRHLSPGEYGAFSKKAHPNLNYLQRELSTEYVYVNRSGTFVKEVLGFTLVKDLAAVKTRPEMYMFDVDTDKVLERTTIARNRRDAELSRMEAIAKKESEALLAAALRPSLFSGITQSAASSISSLLLNVVRFSNFSTQSLFGKSSLKVQQPSSYYYKDQVPGVDNRRFTTEGARASAKKEYLHDYTYSTGIMSFLGMSERVWDTGFTTSWDSSQHQSFEEYLASDASSKGPVDSNPMQIYGVMSTPLGQTFVPFFNHLNPGESVSNANAYNAWSTGVATYLSSIDNEQVGPPVAAGVPSASYVRSPAGDKGQNSTFVLDERGTLDESQSQKENLARVFFDNVEVTIDAQESAQHKDWAAFYEAGPSSKSHFSSEFSATFGMFNSIMFRTHEKMQKESWDAYTNYVTQMRIYRERTAELLLLTDPDINVSNSDLYCFIYNESSLMVKNLYLLVRTSRVDIKRLSRLIFDRNEHYSLSSMEHGGVSTAVRNPLDYADMFWPEDSRYSSHLVRGRVPGRNSWHSGGFK